jgi:hypothetical protein
VDPAEYAVVGVNLAAGVGGAILLGRHLRGVSGKPAGAAPYVALLLGVYILECVAIVAGMLLPVFSAALAVVWGIVLGRWLRGRASWRAALRTSFFVSVYTSLPAASFMAVPLVLALGGWPILNADGGARLGIPGFIPWSANTVLGFFAAVAIGTAVVKTLITTTGTFLLHRRSTP